MRFCILRVFIGDKIPFDAKPDVVNSLPYRGLSASDIDTSRSARCGSLGTVHKGDVLSLDSEGAEAIGSATLFAQVILHGRIYLHVCVQLHMYSHATTWLKHMNDRMVWLPIAAIRGVHFHFLSGEKIVLFDRA